MRELTSPREKTSSVYSGHDDADGVPQGIRGNIPELEGVQAKVDADQPYERICYADRRKTERRGVNHP